MTIKKYRLRGWGARLSARLTASVFAVLVGIQHTCAAAVVPQVHYIGAAYAGMFDSIAQRFPFVAEIDGFGAKNPEPDLLTTRSLALLRQIKPVHYAITDAPLPSSASTDQAIDLTLLIDRETVLQTNYTVGGRTIYRVLAEVRAQALYFDVIQSAIERALPLSAAQISTFDHPPSHIEVKHCVELALFGRDGNAGLLGRFSALVDASPYPRGATRSFRVVGVEVKPNARAMLHAQGDGAERVRDLQNAIADTFAETFSADQGVSFIPFASDYVICNRIALSLSNGDRFNLALPTADYAVHLALRGAKKVVFGQSAAGTSLIYGTLFNIRLSEPISGTRYLDGDFKNGAVVKVPATQSANTQDDQFAYDDSIRGLFSHLSSAITTGNRDWVTKATSAPDIAHQLQATKELFQSCR